MRKLLLFSYLIIHISYFFVTPALAQTIDIPYIQTSVGYSAQSIDNLYLPLNACNSDNQVTFGNPDGTYPDLSVMGNGEEWEFRDEYGHNFVVNGVDNANHRLTFDTLSLYDNTTGGTVSYSSCMTRPYIVRPPDTTHQYDTPIIHGLTITPNGCNVSNQVDLDDNTNLASVQVGDIFVDGQNRRLTISAINTTTKVLSLSGNCSTTRQITSRLRHDNSNRSTIFWFGQINNDIEIPNPPGYPYNPTTYPNLIGTNYLENKVGYDDAKLHFTVFVADRRVWQQSITGAADPLAADQWDTLSIYFNLTPNATSLTPQSYRFDIQATDQSKTYCGSNITPSQCRRQRFFQQAYHWDGNSWVTFPNTFNTDSSVAWHTVSITTSCNAENVCFPNETCGTTNGCYIGGANNDKDNRGYTLGIDIPWSDFGLTSPPHQNQWDMYLVSYDRDDLANTAITDQYWPSPQSQANNPSTWGKINFSGTTYRTYLESQTDPATKNYAYWESYTPPQITTPQTLTVHAADSASTGGVGSNLCYGGSPHWRFFTDWADLTHPFDNLYIQNQGNIADWPCFSRSYLHFPLPQALLGKTVTSAKLSMVQSSNTGTYNGYKMLAHVFTVDPSSWQTQNNATWNNNANVQTFITGSWLTQLAPRTVNDRWLLEPNGLQRKVYWDVTKTVADAALSSQSTLDLGLYITGDQMHMGEIFIRHNPHTRPYPTPTSYWLNDKCGPQGLDSGCYYPALEITYGDPVNPPTGGPPPSGDLNNSGHVDFLDILYLLSNFSQYNIFTLNTIITHYGQ